MHLHASPFHLVDTTMFFCPRSGGVKRYLLAKREWLAREAPAVRHTLLAPTSQPPDAAVTVCDTFSVALVDEYRFPLSVRAWSRALVALKPDLIEAADPYVPGWAARDAGQRLGIPTVAFFHSDLPRMLQHRVGSWATPLAGRYLRRLYSGFDLVLAPSRVMLERLHLLGLEHARLQPLGVDTTLFTPERRNPNLRATLGLPRDTRLLIYAGRLTREKNLPALIGAVQCLGKPYHLLIVGGLQRVSLAENVTVLPFEHDTPTLARILASADAVVHAGDLETFGLVIVEALACGVPVVAVAGGALPELIGPEEGLLVPRAAVDPLAEGIAALFERDLAALGRAARAKAVRQFSWNAAFRVLLSHYARLQNYPVALGTEALPADG